MPHLAAAAAAAVAAAAPAGVTAAVATTAATTAAKVGVMATLKTIAIKAATNFAISAAMSALQPQVGAAGRPVEWTLNPDGPIPFAAGRVGVAGSVIHKETFGPDLMYYGLVSVLSGAGPIDGYVSFRGDDEAVTFNAAGKAITSQWRDEMWLKTTLGTQPDAALASPSGLKNNALLPGWSNAHKLSGKASYMLVMGENSKRSAYPMGEVKPLHVIRGLRCWDPRLDSTYPGGSGACRLDTPGTWVYSENPYIWALKWSLGLWEGPTLKGAPAHGSSTDYQVGGIGAKLSGIDVTTLVAAANIADEYGWTCAAYPTTDDDKSQVLDAFLQAGGAIYAQRAGKISCIQRAAPRTSIVTISAADTAGPIEIDTAASRIDRINTIRPKYWSEAHRWQMTALDDVTAEAYRVEDGGTRPRPLDFHYVSNASQVPQLAALQIAHTREGIAGIIPLKPHLQRIKPGDAFTITEPGFVLNGVKCLALNTEFDPATKIVRVTFVSETDAKYPWALGQSAVPPAPPVLTPFDPTYVSPPLPGDWTIAPRPPATGGGQVPGFDLSGAVSNDTATAVLVEYGPSAAGPWQQAYQGPPTVQNIPLDGVQPGQTYYVAVRYQRNQNYSDRYVYGPYVAPALVAGDTTHLKGEPVQDVLDRLTDVQTLSGQNAEAVADLEAVYGDTVSAAQSAAEAAAAAANAITAKADAIIASSDAEGFSAAASEAATAAAGDAASALSSKNAAATSASNAATSASNASGHASTASTQAGAAAASATDAANRATAAAGSATTASTKATEAGNSASAANAAKVSAESARDAANGSASAASGSASSAATSATNAGTSASAANTAKTAAETAKGQAQTFATNAADSATTAQGAATTATSQAGLATTAKNNAESASTAAVNSRNQASSFADAADVASSAATNASVSADLAAATTLPSRPGDGLKYFTGSLAGLPSASAPLASTVSVASVAGVGAVAETSVPNWINTKGWVPIGVGRVHEVVVRVRVSADGTNPNRTQYGFRLTNAAGLNGGSVVLGATHVAADGFIELRYTRTSAQLQAISADSTHFRAGAMVAVQTGSNSPSGATVQVAEVRYRDITEAQAAQTQALAAATSASNASASQTAAGISATAANTAKTDAETARGQAQTSATQAANSQTAAAGSASSASTSATNAANSRDASAGSAAAAAGSASTATTKASEAGTFASSALASSASATASAKDAVIGAAATLPERPADTQYFTSTLSGSPSNVAPLPEAGLSPATDPVEGVVLRIAGTVKHVWSKGWIAIGDGLVHRITARVKVASDGPNPNRSQVGVRLTNGANLNGGQQATQLIHGAVDGWRTIVYEQTSAQLKAASPDSTHFRIGGYFNVITTGTTTSGATSDIAYLKYENVTALKAAEASATASATSASQASASQNAAGLSAAASAGSATNAATSAGQALTHRNAASDARDGAVAASLSSGTSATASRDAADDAEAERLLAQGAAATAVTQSTSATASAQAAAISAELASGVSVNANMMPNGSGENGVEGWYSPLSGFYAADWAPFGGRIIKQDLVGTIPQTNVAAPRASVEPGQTVTASWRGWLEYFTGTAQVCIIWRTAVGGFISSTPRVNLTASPAKLTAVAPANAKTAEVTFIISGTGTEGAGMAVSRVKIENGPNATAYTTDRSDINLQAALNLTMATTTDVANRMASVAFGVTGGAGGDPFEILMKAGPDGSMATVSATAILLRNIIDGNAVEALKLINGEAYFGAPVSVTVTDRRLTIGPGFGVSGGLVMWFGPSGTAIASMSRTNGYFALGTDGKVYYGSAELPSGGGGGSGGAAFNRASVASSISGTSWQTISSITFNGKPSGGWWQAGVSGLGGYADGTNNTDIEFRIIELGASSPLATSWPVTIQAGMTGPVEEPAFSPGAPWAQTRPAGDLTLLLQARQTASFGTFTHFTSGNFVINYTPGA